MNKIYISGQITGRLYKDAKCHFDEGCLKAKLLMLEPINPMAIEHNHDLSWENYMRTDIIAMMGCQSIFMLKNWDASVGATIEYNLAKSLNMKIYFEH
jgi:hypothetical protein